MVVPASKLRWPVLKELEEGSVVLKDLASGTESAVREGKAKFLKAVKVIFGELDKVVIVRDFCNDEPMDVIEGKGHKDVCKPNNYLFPRSPGIRFGAVISDLLQNNYVKLKRDVRRNSGTTCSKADR